MDIIHFLQLCKYIDYYPIPYVQEVVVKKKPSVWDRKPQNNAADNKDNEPSALSEGMSNLLGMLGGIR